jgi:hypothetical protein
MLGRLLMSKTNAPCSALADKGKAGRIPPLWDGRTTKRILDIFWKEVSGACIVAVSNNS